MSIITKIRHFCFNSDVMKWNEEKYKTCVICRINEYSRALAVLL